MGSGSRDHGTITPDSSGGVTVKYISGASQYSNIAPYPIQAVFTGPASAPMVPRWRIVWYNTANVIETPAPLKVVVPAYTTVYGAASFNFASRMVITGALGNDLSKLSATFTPTDSSILNVNGGTAYAVAATMTGKPIRRLLGEDHQWHRYRNSRSDRG